MPPDQRALFTGLAYGDDRAQSAAVADDFRGSGLTHLLAVSGENVAFAVSLAGPLLRRLGVVPRWLATLVVIVAFALVTRFEPSVARAGVMAGLSASAFALGRPASGVRLLALAVAGLVLVDPQLTSSLGFRLSVAASGGILLLGPALRRWLPGPALLVEPLAVTVAAQVAVAPLLVASFGGIPVASVPANLAAGPAAGFVMVWGLGAGLLAGVVGGVPALLLHLPTRSAIAWIAGVARVSSTLPLGELHAPHLVVSVGGLVLCGLAHHRRARAVRVTGAALVLLASAAPGVALTRIPAGHVPVAGGGLWRAGGGTVLVVGGRTDEGELLESLRHLGVRRVDLLVCTGTPKASTAALAAVAHRWPPRVAWCPARASPAVGQRAIVGRVVITALSVHPRLSVGVEIARPPRRRR